MKLFEIFQTFGAIIVGGAIGWGFGLLQQAATRRNERLQTTVKLNHTWSLMPGSMTRVAFLLVALALVQVICPMFFTSTAQWCVSAGVIAGYGWMLYQSMRARLAARV
ncbi:MAG: hypothetical protein ACXWIU_11820 [Limisphaerales bacterium]